MDICAASGAKLDAFIMSFVPGMDYTAHWCDLAWERWRVKVREYQHWNVCYYLRGGIFCRGADCPIVTVSDVEACAKVDSGTDWCGWGFKKIDSLQRRGWLTKDWPKGRNEAKGQFTVIGDWSNTDVKNYLAARRLPIPGISGQRTTGINLLPENMLFLRTNWPNDYRRVLRAFPGAAAQADRALRIREKKAAA